MQTELVFKLFGLHLMVFQILAYITYIGDYAYESRKERNDRKGTGKNKKLVKISSF